MTDFPGQPENETRADFCHPEAVRIDTPTNKTPKYYEKYIIVVGFCAAGTPCAVM